MHLTTEQAEQLREFIANIFTDANMALNGDGDFHDGGFELIRDNAKQLYQELFGLDVEECPEFEDYMEERRVDTA
jgi:hypothetical protein